MIEKRKTPWGVFLIVLIIMMIAAYFGCGLFKLDDVTINNYQEKLLYIVSHPFRSWWTDKTPAFIGLVFVAWIMFIAYYLDQNRNYHFGVENGSEQWADVKKLSKTLRDSKNEQNNTYLSEHIAVSNHALSNIRKRKKQKRASVGTSIDQRPEEINNREQVGHWEMDSVVGPQGKSKKTFLVLTERKSLKEIIEPLKNHSSNEVVRALDRLERELGEKKFREIFKSITVDNGMEFSDHEGIERSRRNKKNRTKVYYCHAYRSCERARNENQNRFIRRFYPKGANFDHITRREVKEIEVWMNDYARKMFDGRTSDEMYELFREEEKEWNMA